MISENGLYTPIYIFSCQLEKNTFSYCFSCNEKTLECEKITGKDPSQLQKKVWDKWLSYKNKYRSIKFVGKNVFPHLTNFFRQCVLQDKKNKFKGPTPIHDISLLTNASLLPAEEINTVFYHLCIKKIPRTIKNYQTILSFDVESWGLYGPPFWIAYTILINKRESLSGNFFCDPQSALNESVDNSDKSWVEKNVLPHTLKISRTHKTSQEILQAFGNLWASFSKSYPENVVIGKRVFPIEASVIVDSIKSNLPRAIIDVQSFIEVAGISEKSFPRESQELPIHHPLGDARYAARLFLIANKPSDSISHSY